MKVIEEKPVPTEQITCSNCKSILEYGNADLYKDYKESPYANYAASFVCHYFYCPVCGCRVDAHWITKKGDNDESKN